MLYPREWHVRGYPAHIIIPSSATVAIVVLDINGNKAGEDVAGPLPAGKLAAPGGNGGGGPRCTPYFGGMALVGV